IQVNQVDNVTPVPWHAAELFPLIERDRITQVLTKRGGKHVILVRYGSNHSPFSEYVYNGADIDGSNIIWARELANPLANGPLISYYRDSSIWLLKPDESPMLEPHPLSEQYYRRLRTRSPEESGEFGPPPLNR